MNRIALLLALLLLAAAARPGGAAPADSAASKPAVTRGSVMAAPPPAAPPEAAARPKSRYPAPDSGLVASLRQGGLILVFRHGQTDWAQRDSDLLHLAERSTQRNLSPEGRRIMTGVGKAIAALDLPIGKVLASPMWRCRDTATLAFGRCDTTSALFLRGPEYRAERVTMLGTVPEPGKDDVLVTHQDQIMPILGLLRDELGEGEALVIRPEGDGKFEVLAQVTPAQWDELAARAGKATTASEAKSESK
jgi:phosphohistidine phosphatase SixA